jgi:hypothetical protein
VNILNTRVRIAGPLIVVFGAAGCFAQQIRVPLPTGQSNVQVASLVGPHCEWIPIRKGCLTTEAEVNGYYSMAQGASYFSQIRSIYNGASGAATVSADVATLNFLSGIQVTAGTNIQAGSSGSTPQTPNTGTLPTLTSAGSAQAAQNMLYGGTFVVSSRYPLLGYGMKGVSTAGNLAITLDLYAREGVDIQNFQTGASTQVTSPPSHTSAQMVGYLVHNAINPEIDPTTGTSSGFAGSVFLGGAYGYSYTSHGYALDYGIPHVSNGLGQISAGMLINGVAQVAVSRGFGPSQTYTDSATNLPITLTRHSRNQKGKSVTMPEWASNY